ncbi:MAG: hypothetical protein ABFD05_01310 [Anaerolineaceae bacterium]
MKEQDELQIATSLRSLQASITNRRPSVTSRARCAHRRFKRWGASQDTGTIKDELQIAA